MILRLEGHCDRPDATVADVARALARIARPDGPTFLVVEDGDRAYAQAAGTNGRYVIESRTFFGEAFQHFRVCHALPGADPEATVHYRQHCVRHPPRRCPLKVRRSEVSSFAEVEQALLTFAAIGRRDDGLQWRDVSAEWLKDTRPRSDEELVIRSIVPKGARR